jgi:hypothetical protein
LESKASGLLEEAWPLEGGLEVCLGGKSAAEGIGCSAVGSRSAAFNKEGAQTLEGGLVGWEEAWRLEGRLEVYSPAGGS